ncbi:MAG: hypothetical protein ABIH50_01850 [bacterium]
MAKNFTAFLALALSLLFIVNPALALQAIMPSVQTSTQEGVNHIYIDEGVENVVLVCEKKDFQKEAESFQDFRYKYLFLWTGIVTAFIVYINTKGR